MTTKTVDIRVDFSDIEIMAMARELAKMQKEKADIDEEKKSTTARYNAEIKAIDEQMDEVSERINNGFHWQPTECRVEYDSATSEYVYYDLNSNKEVKRDPAPDKQQTIFKDPEAEIEADPVEDADFKMLDNNELLSLPAHEDDDDDKY